MIDINLVPEKLRKKKIGQTVKSKVNIPKEAIVGCVGGLCLVLFVVHIVLQVIIFNQYTKVKQLKKETELIAPQKRHVDVVINELRSLQSKINSIKEIVGDKDILWAQKLNQISDNVPRGVWLTKVLLREGILFIEGSSVSKTKQEVINVHVFASNLKKQRDFMAPFSELDVESIQRRDIYSVDIANFSIVAQIAENDSQ